jgi:hypothetical protein
MGELGTMSDMEKELWSLANIITGFAVAQSLAFLYALGQKEFANAVDNPAASWIILLATLGASLIYCGSVYFIGGKGASLTDPQNRGVWTWVTWGRILAISVFNGFVVLMVIVRNLRWYW